MTNQIANDDRHQEEVDSHFSTSASWWKLIYEEGDLVSVIYQQRREVVLEMIAQLSLPRDARILDVGCGAGHTAIALASGGFIVEALDTVPEMLALTRRHASEAGVSDRVITGNGDIQHLCYENDTFDCVIAMGVLPWIVSPGLALKELGRIVKPGCSVIATADNRWRLNHIIDPRFNPILLPLKSAVAHLLDATWIRKKRDQHAWVTMHSRSQIDRYVAEGHLVHTKGVTIGFGPFSFLGKTMLPDSLGVRVHQKLQTLADRNMPLLRSTGAHYIVLARKPIRMERSPVYTPS